MALTYAMNLNLNPALGTAARSGQLQVDRDLQVPKFLQINHDAPARPTIRLPNANLRYQEALDWHKWTNLKGDAASPIVRAVLIELSCEIIRV